MDKRLFPSLLAALFLTGCANNAPPPAHYASRKAAKPVVKADTDILDVASSDGKKPEPDPLVDDGAGATGVDTTDPLLGETNTNKQSVDPLLTPEKLVVNENAPIDSAARYDPKSWPTQKTHWLSAYMGKAKVTMTLNGVGLGTYAAGVTRDVTMRLHSGANTLTVTYAPQDETSYALVNLVEGEHNPPLPPLVSFRQSPLKNSYHSSEETRKLLQPVTRSFAFIAQ